MVAAAAILVSLGIIALIYGIVMKLRAGRVVDAPFVRTGEVAQKGAAAANPKGAISAEGNVTCPQPLLSPVTGTTCIYYEVKVTAEWKDGDTTKTKELGHEKRAAQFAIDDGSGPVWVDAREGGDFEPEQVKEETKSTGLIGGITGQDLAFGNYRVSTGMLSMGTKYTVREEVVPAVPRLYVCGKIGSSNEITAPSWRQLLMTNKSRDQYLASAAGAAKIAFIGGGSGLGVGVILGVISAFVGGGSDDAEAAATASASASAPVAAATATDTATETASATAAAKAPPPPVAKPHTPAARPAHTAPAHTAPAHAASAHKPPPKGKRK